MPNLPSNPIPELNSLAKQYQDNLVTLDGYLASAIETLELTEIDTEWLAQSMGITHRQLRRAIGSLRSKDLLSIPVVRVKTKFKA